MNENQAMEYLDTGRRLMKEALVAVGEFLENKTLRFVLEEVEANEFAVAMGAILDEAVDKQLHLDPRLIREAIDNYNDYFESDSDVYMATLMIEPLVST